MSLPPFRDENSKDNSKKFDQSSPSMDSADPQPTGYSTPDSPYRDQPPSDQLLKPKGRKPTVVLGASILCLGVLLGGGFATASFLNTMSDHDISNVMPKSTSAFFEADLDPSPGQKINLVSMAGKIKAMTGGKAYDTNKDPKEMFTDPLFSNMDYKTEIKPWIGNKVAVATWGDFSKAAADAAKGSSPAVNLSNDVNAVIVFEIKDKGKALEAAQKMDGKKTVYEANDHYLIIAAKQSSLDSYNAEIAKGTLAKNATFNEDRKLLNGQDDVAMAWVNAGEMNADKALNQYISGNLGTSKDIPEKLNGRVVTGVSLSNNSLKVSSKLVGFDTTDSSAQKGLSDVGNLPDDSDVVLGFKDGKTAATKLLNTYEAVAGSSAVNSVNESLSPMGIVLPDDFGSLLGTETSVGIRPGTADDNGFTYRAKNGDMNKIKSIVNNLGSDKITAAYDSGSAVVKYGATSPGKIGNSQNFKNVTGDLNDAQSVAFVDVNKIIHLRRSTSGTDVDKDVNYGVAGMTSSFDPNSKIVSVDLSWAF